MDKYSQLNLKVPATEPEHAVRKAELDSAIAQLEHALPYNYRFCRKVAVGVEIGQDANGRYVVRLLGSTALPTGKIVRNVIMLPITAPTVPLFDETEIDLIQRARKDNPLNLVEIA